jgi:hypothetical protein
MSEWSRISAILLQDLMKRGVCRCGGGDILTSNPIATPQLKMLAPPQAFHVFGICRISQHGLCSPHRE